MKTQHHIQAYYHKSRTVTKCYIYADTLKRRDEILKEYGLIHIETLSVIPYGKPKDLA